MSREAEVLFEQFDETWNLGILAFSILFMAISLLKGPALPIDPAWFALALCLAPIAAKAFVSASAHNFDAYSVFALLATLGALAAGGVFGAAAIAMLARFVSTVVAIEGFRFEQ